MNRAQPMAAQQQRITRSAATPALMAGILLIGLALRVAYVTVDRFHADEALYAGWALLIRDQDPLLLSVPVDKPPLFLYTLAASAIAFGPSEVALRLPNIAASLLGIALIYRLGKGLYGRAAGLLAALFLALSPFDILFARTAFTDPMLMLWVLGALCAVSSGHWFAGGLCMGLAVASKQHAWLLLPLVLAVGLVQTLAASQKKPRLRSTVTCLSKGILGIALPYALVVAWDSARWKIRPGYWEQSALSYGGYRVRAGDRVGAAARRVVAVGALPDPLAGADRSTRGGRNGAADRRMAQTARGRCYPWKGRETEPFADRRQVALDIIWVGYGCGYVTLHVLLRFSVWDRYLLPLAAPIAVVLARVVTHLWEEIPSSPLPFSLAGRRGGEARIVGSARSAGGVVCISAAIPAWRAAHNGYPVGGEHWAYQGLDQIAAYLKDNAPPDAVLYHHWLRWHYSYYLYGTSFELRWWQSAEHLRQEAMRTPDRAQYIVLPDWHTLEPYAEGLTFHLLYEAHRQDGTVSMQSMYQIQVPDPRREQSAVETAPTGLKPTVGLRRRHATSLQRDVWLQALRCDLGRCYDERWDETPYSQRLKPRLQG